MYKVLSFKYTKEEEDNCKFREVNIWLDTKDFLKRALLNEQEQVRDYQRFAMTTDDQEVAAVFRDFAETEAEQATKIKELLGKYDKDFKP